MSTPEEQMPPPAAESVPSAEERQWAMFAHLSALAAGLVSGVVGGWGFFLGPLIIWLIKKDTMPFVADQAKEALNFSIMVSGIFLILTIFTFITLGIGIFLTGPLMLIVGVGALVLVIMAGIKANEGVLYRYPVNLRLIK